MEINAHPLARGELNLCWATLCDHSSRPAGDLSKIHGRVIFFLESPTLAMAYHDMYVFGRSALIAHAKYTMPHAWIKGAFCCTIPDLIVAQGNTCYRFLWFEWLCSGQVEGE